MKNKMDRMRVPKLSKKIIHNAFELGDPRNDNSCMNFFLTDEDKRCCIIRIKIKETCKISLLLEKGSKTQKEDLKCCFCHDVHKRLCMCNMLKKAMKLHYMFSMYYLFPFSPFLCI